MLWRIIPSLMTIISVPLYQRYRQAMDKRPVWWLWLLWGVSILRVVWRVCWWIVF